MFDRDNAAMSHAWVEERLSEYIDNRLAALERARLERHLRDCARCQSRLASLRWTISLVKQAPSPALPRQFTFAIPAQTKRASTFNLTFGFARFATIVATLLLFAVVGVDVIAQFGGAAAPKPAMAPGASEALAAPTAIALAPQATPTQEKRADAQMNAKESALPTSAPPAPTKALEALRPTLTIAQPVAPPAPAGAATGAPEVSATDRAKLFAATPPAARQPAGAPVITTATPVPPTATFAPTATVPPPSPTPIAQVRVQPTLAPLPTPAPQAPRAIFPAVSPLRLAEIGLFFLVVFFGALAILLRRGR
jgi:hypothetical protein